MMRRGIIAAAGAQALLVALWVADSALGAQSARPLRVGLAETEITPDVKDKDRPVFLAGYGMNRRVSGVHDPLFARAVVLQTAATDGDKPAKIALVCVDLVGLQRPEVLRVREKLADFAYVMVSSTHNHEGPDVIGIWGRSPLHRGVDEAYLTQVVERIVECVRAAEKKLAPAVARYGTAQDESLLGDSRRPIAKDGVLRVLRFDAPAAATDRSGKDAEVKSARPLGILVQWNCHPEAMGSKNTQVTADFCAATVEALKKKYGCPVAYFTGPVGGLMAPPDGVIKDAEGRILKEGQWEYTWKYGQRVAELAARAIDSAEPIELGPAKIASAAVAIPLHNPYYKAARAAGVLKREARVWTGDAERIGPVATLADALMTLAVVTEVAYLRLGELHVACIPGEIYPELVYGKYQDPADPGADFPDAPLEKPLMEILPGKKVLLVGLANDEIGYIIPRRQWDQAAPFCYGRRTSQYGEINSCGPRVAPLLMDAFEKRVRAAR